MKIEYKFVVLMMLVLTLLGCENETIDKNLLNQDFTEIQKLSLDNQRDYFNTLSAKKKIAFRRLVIEQFKSSTDLTVNQKNIIAELDEFFTEEIFTNSIVLSRIYNSDMKPWHKRALQYFSQVEINHLVAGPLVGPNEQLLFKSASACSCNVGSIIDCTQSTTTTISATPSRSYNSVACDSAADSGCQLSYNYEDDDDPDSDRSIVLGCGFFWIFSCDGGC